MHATTSDFTPLAEQQQNSADLIGDVGHFNSESHKGHDADGNPTTKVGWNDASNAFLHCGGLLVWSVGSQISRR